MVDCLAKKRKCNMLIRFLFVRLTKKTTSDKCAKHCLATGRSHRM